MLRCHGVAAPNPFQILHRDIVTCGLCPRLRAHCAAIAETKRRAYRDEDYWGKPVPGFGDPDARLLIVGLAPGAHGANRTGRMFTGDKSGDFLYAALHHTGFASQPESRHAADGLELRGAYITASARCAPPDNKPLPAEIRACRPYLERELKLLGGVRAVVALGRIAHDNYLETIGQTRARFPFAHHRVHPLQPPLIDSYHPSQQNTSTGRLTMSMLQAVFETARHLIR